MVWISVRVVCLSGVGKCVCGVDKCVGSVGR